MGFFIVRKPEIEPLPTCPPDPAETVYCNILESDHADLLRGVSLETFRALYQFIYPASYREASRKLLPVVAFALDWMRTDANAVRYWQAAFACGVPDCIGATMTSKALDLGLKSRAALSQGAVNFCEGSGLPPSTWMKQEPARQSYRAAREKTLKSSDV